MLSSVCRRVAGARGGALHRRQPIEPPVCLQRRQHGRSESVQKRANGQWRCAGEPGASPAVWSLTIHMATAAETLPTIVDVLARRAAKTPSRTPLTRAMMRVHSCDVGPSECMARRATHVNCERATPVDPPAGSSFINNCRATQRLIRLWSHCENRRYASEPAPAASGPLRKERGRLMIVALATPPVRPTTRPVALSRLACTPVGSPFLQLGHCSGPAGGVSQKLPAGHGQWSPVGLLNPLNFGTKDLSTKVRSSSACLRCKAYAEVCKGFPKGVCPWCEAGAVARATPPGPTGRAMT